MDGCGAPVDPAATAAAGGTADCSGVGPQLLHLLGSLPGRLGGRPLPRVVAVTVSCRSIGLLLGEPRLDPPEGFDAIDSGLTWTIDRSTVGAPEVLPAPGAPWPLLASLGHLRSDGSLVLGNLEEFGALEAVGEPADVRALAECLAAEIAADRFGGQARIICVNSGSRLADADRVRIVSSAREAVADAEVHRARVRSTEARRAALPELRARGSRGTPPPLVVIDPHAREPALREHFRSLAGPGLGIVAAGDAQSRQASGTGPPAPGHRWLFEVAGRRLRWEPLGVDLEFGHPWDPLPLPVGSNRPDVQPRPAAHAHPVAGSAHHRGPARADGRPPARTAPITGIGECGRRGEPPDARPCGNNGEVTPGRVEVQILGVVQAVGVSSPFTSQRALDLACFLAFHRDGATADRLRHWLWRRGEPVPSRKAFANVVSRARVCLGRDPGGTPYLSRVSAEGVYRLSAEVTTDLERFTAWQRLAERAPPQIALEHLRAALCLVRGVPFGGGSGGTFSWADASWRSHVEYLVDSAAHRLADVALELGRTDLARWATLRGLAVTPGCEQCLQRRIAAAWRSGRRREVDLVLADMNRRDLEPLAGFDDLAYPA